MLCFILYVMFCISAMCQTLKVVIHSAVGTTVEVYEVLRLQEIVINLNAPASSIPVPVLGCPIARRFPLLWLKFEPSAVKAYPPSAAFLDVNQSIPFTCVDRICWKSMKVVDVLTGISKIRWLHLHHLDCVVRRCCIQVEHNSASRAFELNIACRCHSSNG